MITAPIAAAPSVPAPSTPISLVDDLANGRLYLCSYCHGIALIFKGDTAFIDRWYNWAYNTGLVKKNAGLNHFDFNDNIAYVLLKNSDGIYETITRALSAQFRWEIIRDKEIPLLKDEYDEETGPLIEYNEPAIEHLAAERAREYMSHMTVSSTVLQKTNRDVGDVYHVSRAVGDIAA